MGGDGGSIPKRADVVRTSGYRFIRNLGGLGYLPNSQVRSDTEKYRDSEQRDIRWKTCYLTSLPLHPPLVACRLGYIYNKEILIERFLNRKTSPLPSELSHIQNRKDFRDLKVEFDNVSGKLLCPVTKVEFDSGVKGLFFWSCGCVVSLKAVETLNQYTTQEPENMNSNTHKRPAKSNETSYNKCPVCSTLYSIDDIVHLIPLSNTVIDLRQKLLLAKEASKTKRRKNCSLMQTTENQSNTAPMDKSNLISV